MLSFMQNVLRLWPSLLVSNAMTVQQSLCLDQPTSNPPYIQKVPAKPDSALSNLYTGILEEIATMLRQVFCMLAMLPLAPLPHAICALCSIVLTSIFVW